MPMEPWYKVALPRKEVREGRSFNPDEFAIALEQVVAGTAPEDYRDPVQFFARTWFTRALRDHVGMVLRRLAGQTENTSPVLMLITQFGGGKTHTLTSLYHLATHGDKVANDRGIITLLQEAGLSAIPRARAAVFVGNAWDPRPGRETPWIDIARQLGGDRGVEELGPAAKTTPPGTEAIQRVFHSAGSPVILLLDEVLNFLSRYRASAEPFRDFLHNLTVAMTGATHSACVISLPRSQVEMTDWDQEWQDKIAKVVRRVAKDLIANDETEISEVVRRRLFDDLGPEKTRRSIARTFGDWCFERRAQLPPEWTAVDSTATEAKAREYLQQRFEACYPFHPATLSVFQRKWQALPQYQQTRGTLAMLAQWISIASQDAFMKARTEPLITLGSAPLSVLGFRSVVLGQLGEPRLVAAIDTDIAGDQAHTKALDADTKGPLRDIHRRVGSAILFESSGGQTDKVAHLPELRFALGEPDVDTTTIDNAAISLEERSYFIRKSGTDGYKIGYQAKMNKVVNDRRASLDERSEVRPAMLKLIGDEFRHGASLPIVTFPSDSTEIPDNPRLSVVVADPELEWSDPGAARELVANWTRERGKSPRLFPAALVWCIKKPGRGLRERVELMLAWRRVAREVADGTLGGEYEQSDRAGLLANVKDAEDNARDEVWSDYRFAVLADSSESTGLKTIDLGAGHSSSGETLCGRLVAALKSEAMLNESVGAGYIERNWPPALRESGAWPLASLRQSFLDGSLTRLVDPDSTLRARIGDAVAAGDFGLASGRRADGFDRIWISQVVPADEITFDADVYLVRKDVATSVNPEIVEPPPAPVAADTSPPTGTEPPSDDGEPPVGSEVSLHLAGEIPPEMWNRLGTRVLPKLRPGADLRITVHFAVRADPGVAKAIVADLNTTLDELGLKESLNLSED